MLVLFCIVILVGVALLVLLGLLALFFFIFLLLLHVRKKLLSVFLVVADVLHSRFRCSEFLLADVLHRRLEVLFLNSL